jgi:hypothetical protein
MRHAFGNHTCERNLKDAIKITHELPQTRCMLPYTRSHKEVLDLRSAAVKPTHLLRHRFTPTCAVRPAQGDKGTQIR